MSARRSTSLSDEQLREALTRRPEAHLVAADLAALVATARSTRQGRTVTAGWMLAAALVALALIALIGALAAMSRRAPHAIGQVAVDVDHGIVVVNGDGSALRRLTSGSDSAWQPQFSPDGSHMVFWSDDPILLGDTCGVICLSSPRRLMLVDMPDTGAPRTSLLTTVSNKSGWRVSWAPDSRRIVFGDVVNGVRVLVVVDTTTHIRTQIGPADLDGWDPAWSPDGRHIAFVRGHDDLKLRGLYVMGTDASNVRRLTTIPSRGAGFLSPVWSPTSDRLAFAAETGGPDPFQRDIWVVGLDGLPEHDVSNNAADEQAPGWSPDGAQLAWVRETATGSSQFHVVVANADGTGQNMLPEVVGPATAVWSPDGTRILAVELAASSAGLDRMVAIDVGTGAEVVLVAGHPDGVGSWRQVPP